jgi:hypothetical protein
VSAKVNTRAFTVPTGRLWTCVPADGGGPIVAHPGETVMVIVAHSWESAMREAMEKLMKPEADK